MILIVYFLSCTASSQNDSTYCFTKGQVKEFLLTKVELNNCNEQYSIVYNEKEAISDSLTAVVSDNVTLDKRVKRNRTGWIITGGGIIIIEGVRQLFKKD